MKTHRFFSLLASLTLFAAATAQVHVQPVIGVHTVKVEDAVTLIVYRGDKTQIEANSPMHVATVTKGVMAIEGNDEIILRLNPADGIVTFTAEDAATIFFNGSFDFDDRQLIVTAKDNAEVEIKARLNAGYIIFEAHDNSRIVSKLPLHVNAYNFKAADNAYIEVPSVSDKPVTDSTVDRSHYITIEDNGQIVIRDKGKVGVYSVRDGRINIHPDGKWNSKPNRNFEVIWTWGFNHWLGDHPFSGRFGEPYNAAAEVSYYPLNLGLSFEYPLVNTSHFGIYAGLGVEANRYHFREHQVVATPTGFEAVSSATPASVTLSGTSDPNNWDSYFTTATMIVPITFSFEPGEYDDLCIRLTAIPGINVRGFLGQEYDSKSFDLESRDMEAGKKLNPFVFDTRLALMYGEHIGIYAQMSFCKLFDFGLYPLKFGLILNLTGR